MNMQNSDSFGEKHLLDVWINTMLIQIECIINYSNFLQSFLISLSEILDVAIHASTHLTKLPICRLEDQLRTS